MARAGAELLAEADLIAPVPLHWRRLFTRRYNQAPAAGAHRRRAAQSRGAGWSPDLLRRAALDRLAGRTARPQERRDNVRRAFDAPSALGGGGRRARRSCWSTTC